MKRISLKWPLIISSSTLAILIFIVPLYGATVYSFKGAGGKGHSWANYQWLIHQDGFAPALLTSLKLAVLAALFNLVLMVPTMVYLNLKGQKLAMPDFLQNTEYELVFFFVIIALPYTYRALETSLQTVPLKTLVEASRSLGASWSATIIRVIVPAIRSGITGAVFLTFALSIGEYTITSLLHWETFPTWTVVAGQQNILGAIAISVFSFVGAIALLTVISLFSKKGEQRVEVDE